MEKISIPGQNIHRWLIRSRFPFLFPTWIMVRYMGWDFAINRLVNQIQGVLVIRFPQNSRVSGICVWKGALSIVYISFWDEGGWGVQLFYLCVPIPFFLELPCLSFLGEWSSLGNPKLLIIEFLLGLFVLRTLGLMRIG